MGEFFAGVAGLMVFGSMLWWFLTVAWVFTMFWCVEKENNFMSGFWLIVYLLFLHFLAEVEIFRVLAHEPLKCLSYVAGYILIGLTWSFVKWWLYVSKRALKARELRMEFIKEERHRCRADDSDITLDTPVPKELLERWRNKIGGYGRNIIPQVHEYKNKIALWITYWPFSMVWSVMNDFIKKLAHILVLKFRAVYHAITMRAYKGTDIGGINVS